MSKPLNKQDVYNESMSACFMRITEDLSSLTLYSIYKDAPIPPNIWTKVMIESIASIANFLDYYVQLPEGYFRDERYGDNEDNVPTLDNPYKITIVRTDADLMTYPGSDSSQSNSTITPVATFTVTDGVGKWEE